MLVGLLQTMHQMATLGVVEEAGKGCNQVVLLELVEL